MALQVAHGDPFRFWPATKLLSETLFRFASRFYRTRSGNALMIADKCDCHWFVLWCTDSYRELYPCHTYRRSAGDRCALSDFDHFHQSAVKTPKNVAHFALWLALTATICVPGVILVRSQRKYATCYTLSLRPSRPHCTFATCTWAILRPHQSLSNFRQLSVHHNKN